MTFVQSASQKYRVVQQKFYRRFLLTNPPQFSCNYS